MKQRYFLYCSYKGTAYHGWQVQPNGISVQEVITNALRTVLRDDKLAILGAGRTDTGVHAKEMTAHFDSDIVRNTASLRTKLNSFLPKDIAIHKIVPVKNDAHARFDAISRIYQYHICLRKDVFKTELSTRVSEQLDFETMNHAAGCLLDYTDFTSFSKLHTDVKTNNCIITHAGWTQKDDEWIFTISADRFLRNMVRAIVGTLLDVGREKITIEEFKTIIERKDRSAAGTSAPAQGLYLVKVNYPDEIFI